MIKLIEPCEEYISSYKEAYDEYAAQGSSTYGLSNARETDILAKIQDYRLGNNLKPGRVRSDSYWLVDDEQKIFIGEIRLRHALNESLQLRGGHIGYVVRYSSWNRGYGTKMLSLVLEKAKERGLTRVLCTCNDSNPASARVMEHNGFVLKDKVEVDGTLIRRYWKTL